MQLLFVDADGAHEHPTGDVEGLRRREGGFLWLDVPTWDDEADALLAGLGCHSMLRQACAERNFVQVLHAYEEHVFVTVQVPMSGLGGHVHLLELDQVIGERFLVTVHGPISPEVALEEALRETQQTLGRIEAGRFRPRAPAELAYAITSAVARRQSALVRSVAAKLPGLETEVMASALRDPEALLERMFLIRHELLTARTMANQCHEIWQRLAGLGRLPGDPDGSRSADLADQFDRVRALADGEAQFLFGVIELYQTKVHTKMTVAMERLAVIAAVTLPITAIASISGMNVIVSRGTHWFALALLLGLMLVISLYLLRWARKQGWW
jgi:Mg2+ and Co2+ transporter CorA